MNSSALEHSVPEQFFSTAENSAKGISSVKALQLANSQGIPIYTISQSNVATILPQLKLDSGMIGDIQNAVNAGKIVTAPKNDIVFNGWTGSGYIIIDPNTNAGAYMISGGSNGAYFSYIGAFFSGLLAGLAEKYQKPGAMFGDLKKIANAKAIKLFGQVTFALNIVNTIISTITNPTLNWSQMAATIIPTIIFSIAEYVVGAAVAATLALPWGILASVVLSMIFAAILDIITSSLIELFAMYFRIEHKNYVLRRNYETTI